MMNFEELIFSDVTQITVQQSIITIHFTVKDIDYLLAVHPDEQGVYAPRLITHLNENREYRTSCEYDCGLCHDFNEHKETLFHYLITFPSIRLHWLYLSYQEVKT